MHTETAIPEFLTAAVHYGNQVIAARARIEAAHAASQAAEARAEIAAAWQPVLATIHQATPDWAHPFITTPADANPTFMDTYYDTYHLPAVIDLSTLLDDVPPIRVWAIPHRTNPRIRFEAGRYNLFHDDDDGWCVITRFDTYKAIDHDLHYIQPGVPGAEDDFHIALAQAVADRTDRAALQAQADGFNAALTLVEVPAPEPVAAVAAVEADPLTRIADALERLTSLYETHLPY